MDKFDLNLLRVVVAIHDARSVSNAAKSLGISQPAASSALARLRSALGDPLFIKTSRGMEPTPQALKLVPTAREVLNRVHRNLLSKAAFDPGTTRQAFTVALSDIGEIVFLPKLLDYLGNHAPRAVVRSISISHSKVESGLANGDIDLAVGYFPDLKKKNYIQQRLFTHAYVCLLRGDHPIRSRKLTLQQFLKLDHATVRTEGRSRDIFERYLEKRKIRRKIALLTSHLLSLPAIVARSDLVITVPQALALYFARSGANVRIIEPPFAIPPIELKQHWHRKFHMDLKVTWLRKVVAELFNDVTDEWKTDVAALSDQA